MRRSYAAAAAIVAATTLASLASPRAIPPGGFAPTLVPLQDQAEQRTFRTYDANGARGRDATWRVTEAPGNCCEVYVASTPTGRLVDFGGTYPAFSDDRGGTWTQVRTQLPLVTGEGAISAAPGGDVVGVGWDAYGGDHLQAFRYDGEGRTWSYAEIPLHEPQYDRPWIVVVPGPFTTVTGAVADYATVVRSNWESGAKDAFLVSFDGLDYQPMTDAAEVLLGTGRTDGYLDPSNAPMLDYLQPQRKMRLAPLPGGGLLNVEPALSTSLCPSTIWSRAQQWSCFSMRGHDLGSSVVIDSRGWLHQVNPVDGEIEYALSPDGGRTWREATFALPFDAIVDGATLTDVKANGAVGVAAVSLHVPVSETYQDFVVKVDVSTPTPRLVETMLLGNGDRFTGHDVSATGPRFDFASLAILPDGALAVAYDDAAHDDPVLAIEMEPRTRACVPAPRRRC